MVTKAVAGPKAVKKAVAGLEALIGERVLFLCTNYFYAGKLIALAGADASASAVLEDASVVYETGAWGEPQWKDAQNMKRKQIGVRLDAIESFMPER